MKNRILTILSMLFLGVLLSGAVSAQGIRVTGKVTDAADGTALAGVTVVEKGTTNGTMSDVNGSFTITVNPNSTLVVSYVGYLNQEVAVNNRSSIDIALSVDVQALSEVVVIGYGTVAKKDATGSVVAVGTRDFNKTASTRPQDLIVGKIPGVQIVSDGGSPAAGATIRIRGGSSLSASNSPLIVIDGVPVDNGGVSGMGNPLSLVNSNDIESFTVLKDASATAIFGSRASNGVIIITTKKGAAGRPFKVTYDGSVSVGTRTGSVDVLTAEELRSVVYARYAPGSPAVLKMGTANTDWQSEIYQTAVTLDHNLSASGSIKKVPYRVSLGYTDQTGILKTSEQQRLTSAINVNPTFLDDHLSVLFNVKFMNIRNRFANQGAIGAATSMDPTQPVYDATSSKYGGYFTWKQANGDPLFVIAPFNPVALLELTNDRADVNRALGNVQVDYKLHFLPDLKITVNAGADYSWSDGKIVVPQYAAWYYNATEGYGRNSWYTQEKRNELLDVYGNYKKELTSINSRIDVTAGYSWQHFYNEGEGATLNFAKSKTISSYSNATENYLVSFFGRVNYIFADKYLLTATLRNDGSSRFAKENRWGLFPSFALAWDVKEEGFLQNVSLINNLKIRLGYGITGQQDISSSNYPYMATYLFSYDNARYQFGNEFYTTIRPSGYDRNLKWEETTTYNAAIDFALLKDRISGTVEAYYRPTKDLINTIDVPAGTNLTNRITTNVGNLVNQGIEVSLNLKPVLAPTYEWSIGLNATLNRNEITKLTALDDPNFIGVETGGISGGVGNNVQIHTVGYPVSSFYLAQQVYDSKGNPIDDLFVDRNGDGNVTSQGQSDKYRIHSPAADLLLGFNSMFRYKDFDFSFSGRVSLGNYIYNNVASGSSYAGIYNSGGVIYNLNSSILRTKFANPQYWSDYFLENGSFLRLDNMTIGYNLPEFAQGAAKMRAYATVQNLFLITKYSGLDPEIFGGIDSNIYPRPRTFIFGVNLEF